MNEDMSSMIRLGVTVILVASLVAVVLNLAVIAQSTMSSGMSTLQSGVDQISLQRFMQYNQKKVSGTEVASAITLYQGEDVAILIAPFNASNPRTNVHGTSSYTYYNYGALISGTSVAGAGSAATPTVTISTAASAGSSAANAAPKKVTGDSFYTGTFNLTSSSTVQYYNDTKRTATPSENEYILSSGRFMAELVKTDAGQIIGIAFTQIK